MESDIKKESSSISYFSKIIITECVCVAVILIGLIIIKSFFKPTYKQIKVFYKNEICSNTDINEVLLDGELNNEI